MFLICAVTVQQKMKNKKNEHVRGKKQPENIKTRPNMIIKTINVYDISSAIKQDSD